MVVTGASGFKGAWLCILLDRLGARVTGISKDTDHPDGVFNVVRSEAFVSHKLVDLTNYQQVVDVLKAERPQILFHLAAQPLVRESVENPRATMNSNILGGYNLLEAIRASETLKSVVFITTDKVYRNKNDKKSFQESDVLGGSDPYSCSKACLELIVQCYNETYFEKTRHLNLVTARAGNVLGGGDWGKDRLIPDFVRSVLTASTIRLRYPHAVRPWQFVLDALHGYITLAERLYEDTTFNETAFNFGPHEAVDTKVLALIDMLADAIGKQTKIEIPKTPPRTHEKEFLQLNSKKARDILGWKPLLTTSDAVIWTGEWYHEFLNGKKRITEITYDQVDRYIQMMRGNNEKM